MSGNAVRVGDKGTAHDGFPETPVVTGSGNVFFDGIPASRVGDTLISHYKPKNPPHGRTIASGSSTVLINGKPAAKSGGTVSCGGVTVGGGSVFIGDRGYQPPTNNPQPLVFNFGLFRILNQVSNQPAEVMVPTLPSPTITRTALLQAESLGLPAVKPCPNMRPS